MNKASDDLKHEHEAVLFALKILEKMCTEQRSGNEVSNKDLSKIIDFFKLFADTCHHGKEEKFLFPALEEEGIGKTNGPIGVMLAEHEQGRKYMTGMIKALAGNRDTENEFQLMANSYITLLRGHIDKENNILFPMGDLRLSASKQQDLLEKFARFEDEVIGKGKHKELHQLLNDLQSKYNSI